MKSNLIRGILLGSIALLCSTSFSVLVVHAAELPCGNIIAPERWMDSSSDTVATPIEDCGDPFEISTGVSSPYVLLIEDEEVSENDIAVISEVGTSNYTVVGTPILDNAQNFFFRHDGDDYRFINIEPVGPTEEDFRGFAAIFFSSEIDKEPYILAILEGEPWNYELDEDLFWQFQNEFWNQFVEEPVKLLPGTYTLVIKESEFILTQGFFRQFFASIVPTVHAEEYSEYTFAITFTLAVEEEETLSPLLLEYLPILRMHPEEDYLPMNVEAFVGGSALWNDKGIFPDELVAASDPEDPIMIDDLALFNDSDNLYLAFSDPDNAKSLDLAVALFKYKELVDEDIAQTTVYARKMQDSFEDSFGETHKYIVLQYWYFYAMNNWKEKGGLNNHEGDWESVFVFLDGDTEEPKYVAFSAHHNDGDPAWNLLQYDSVRREWSDDDVERDGTNVMSYVALGSHANYPKPGEYIIPTPPPASAPIDYTSSDGSYVTKYDFESKIEIDETHPNWLVYKGKWGADFVDLVGEDSGPRGPYFVDVSGHLRYRNPLEWAGIDKIEEVFTEEPTTIFSFLGTGIQLNFDALVPVGSYFSTAPYFETPRGTYPKGAQLFSPFWDIESNLENGTFNTQVSLPINRAFLQKVGDLPSFNAYWLNPETNGWEKQQSTIDETGNFVIFNTTHFSRYAIGVETALETSIIEEGETVSSKSIGTRVGDRNTFMKVSKSFSLAQNIVTPDTEMAAYGTLVTLLEQVIVMYKEKGHLTPLEVQSVVEQLNQIVLLLRS